MRGSDERSGDLFSYVDLEERIPAKHPLRLIWGNDQVSLWEMLAREAWMALAAFAALILLWLALCDVVTRRQVALAEHGRITEGGLRFALGCGDFAWQS